jgi:hypothetical protein
MQLLHQYPRIVFDRDKGDPSQSQTYRSTSRPGQTALYVAAGQNPRRQGCGTLVVTVFLGMSHQEFDPVTINSLATEVSDV